jgi:hypothetical protein
VERTHTIATSAAQRREGAIAASRAAGSQVLVHGPDGVRGGGVGAIRREADQRRRGVEQWRKTQLAVPDPDRDWVAQETMRRFEEIRRWEEGGEGEAWARGRVDEHRERRDAAAADGRAARRVDVLDQLAEIDRLNGNGSA